MKFSFSVVRPPPSSSLSREGGWKWPKKFAGGSSTPSGRVLGPKELARGQKPSCGSRVTSARPKNFGRLCVLSGWKSLNKKAPFRWLEVKSPVTVGDELLVQLVSFFEPHSNFFQEIGVGLKEGKFFWISPSLIFRISKN